MNGLRILINKDIGVIQYGNLQNDYQKGSR